eukprot:TRINITY_DN9911_c0_g4_i2.p1 TRINITY_DN9911_c0_g4~~TRINITY_DN9911_c0_g4_i2.p1  ORF type:complete len:168 (+),score=24.87 TRINITY_DN9911_c0_g4_i2:34-504(+)
MRRYFGDIFKDVTCPLCDEPNESDAHLFSFCQGSLLHNETLWNSINTIIFDKATSPLQVDLLEHARWIPGQDIDGNPQWFLGGIPEDARTVIRMASSSNQEVLEKEILIIIEVFCCARRKWEERCEALVEKGWTYKDLMRKAFPMASADQPNYEEL